MRQACAGNAAHPPESSGEMIHGLRPGRGTIIFHITVGDPLGSDLAPSLPHQRPRLTCDCPRPQTTTIPQDPLSPGAPSVPLQSSLGTSNPPCQGLPQVDSRLDASGLGGLALSVLTCPPQASCLMWTDTIDWGCDSYRHHHHPLHHLSPLGSIQVTTASQGP